MVELASAACFHDLSPAALTPAAALLSRDPAVFVQPCRLTIALIQIGAKGEVQPFETG